MDTIDISKLRLWNRESVIIEAFAPRIVHDSSPTSSMASGPSSPPLSSNTHNDAFFTTRSRVVRLYNLPVMPEYMLSAVFLPHNTIEQPQLRIPIPNSLWELREDFSNGRRDTIWAVFRTHDEACAALSLSGRAMSVATALESDLEPFHKLHRVVLRNPASSSSLRNNILDLQPPAPLLRVSSSLSDIHSPMSETSSHSLGEYTLSTNPPNPKTSFRLGDWICRSPNCAAHNFGRNLTCIGCGCPRSNNGNGSGSSTLHQHQQHPHNHSVHQQLSSSSARAPPSPRFNNVTYYSTGPSSQTQQQHQQARLQQQHLAVGQHHTPTLAQLQQPSQQQRLSLLPSSFGSSPTSSASSAVPHVAVNTPKTSHPLLTPSGRAFAIGGRVQNISSDPLSPCIMYWPDNEPFPEQGQIRPGGLTGINQPPILNTGNRGPISHQPGDWICQKCNYLNWRRRKVCQTCLPYAEGNGDSISAAVQAERIALLTSVLQQTHLNGDPEENGSGNLSVPGLSVSQVPASPRSHSLTPPQVRHSPIDLTSVQARAVHRSQSHLSLGQQFASASSQSSLYTSSTPIYQTSGNRQPQPQQPQPLSRQPSPLYSTGPAGPIPTLRGVSSQGNLAVGSNAPIGTPKNATVINKANDNVHLTSFSIHAPAPLLPSFLQDMVQSPALSPTSTTTSSADLSSIEEYEDVSSPRAIFPRARGDSGSSDLSSPIANIWRLDGEESKSLSAFPLPNKQELQIGARKNSLCGESLLI